MGLDMYLHKKTDVKNWNFTSPEEEHKVSVKKGGKKHGHIKPNRVSGITEAVGYWRKSNQIHQWFVNHVQEGVDDCGTYDVSEEKLVELRDICKKTIEYMKTCKNGEDYDVDETVLKGLLPTTSGFFFGSTQYDQWYFNDLKDTIKIIDDSFKGCEGDGNKIGWDITFEYHSSW